VDGQKKRVAKARPTARREMPKTAFFLRISSKYLLASNLGLLIGAFKSFFY
jgi:hypothetical protein